VFELNSREEAILIWLSLAFVAIMFIPKARPALAGLISAFFKPLILVAIGTAITWVALCVALLATLNIWALPHLKGTLVWVVTYGLATLFDVNRLSDTPRALSTLAKEAVAITAIIVFIGEFYTFPLWGELILVPALVFLGLLLAVADSKQETKIVARLSENLLMMAGLGMLGFSVYRIVAGFQEFANLDTLRDFAVPVLLSLMYLPFLYAVLLHLAYQNATSGMKFKFKDNRLRHHAVLRAMMVFGGKIELLQRFKRNMNQADELNRITIDETIKEVWETYKREKNPPHVPWELGWSPFTAQGFLETEGLKTKDYHRFVRDWLADSPSATTDDSLFPSHVTYRIYGTEQFATRLTLTLDVNQLGKAQVADDRFWELAAALLFEAIGNEAVERFQRDCIGRDSGENSINEVSITLTRDNWGIDDQGGYSRRLIICHPAHVPGDNG